MSLSTKVFTYLARIKHVQGEVEQTIPALIVASSENSAWEVAQRGIAGEYDDAEVHENGDVTSHGGDVFTAVRGIQNLGLSSFVELHKTFMTTYVEEGLVIPGDEALTNLKNVGTALTQALQAHGNTIPHGHVLNALASVVGDRNWQQYKARQVPSELLWQIIHHAGEVMSLSDTTGCDDGYTVTYQPEIEALVSKTVELQGKLLDAKATPQ